jgi:two-component system chemotaxis sensor kinase CheA
MNALLEQFLSEAREALEGIGEKLMQLESAPDDVELMTQLFRLVHTLKGNSGLFDFPEMTRVLHAGEDLMDAVRNGRVHYSQALADRLLDAMDFVGMLCDDAEVERAVAPHVAQDAVALAGKLRELIGSTPVDAQFVEVVREAAAAATESVGRTWLDADTVCRIPEAYRLAAMRQAQSGAGLLWLHYAPSEECFFQGDDPLHQSRLTPGLVWGGIRARGPWPPLVELDAYKCVLDFDVLTTATPTEVQAHFRYVPEQIVLQEIHALSLAIPKGNPNGGPVYEDFVEDALAFLDSGDLAGLGRAVRSMLELSSSSLWLASALRWISLLLESDSVNTVAVRTLLESLLTLTAPCWSEVAGVHETPTQDPPAQDTPVPAPQVQSPQAQAHAEVTAEVVAVQREVLSLTDSPAWLAGRLKAAAAALAGCLRAAGRTDQDAALELATREGVQSQSAAPLAEWLDRVFPLASAVLPLADPEQVLASPSLASAAPELEDAVEAEPAGVAATQPDQEVRFSRRADDVNSIKSLKVDQVKIDRLMNLIGEMVVAKNAIPYIANRAETVYGMRDLSREIKTQYAVINRISEEMQDAIMQIRMMPVSFVMQRFPRLVRDTSRKLGKEVNLVLEGEETSADKNIIEALGDPLVHIVRNSLDHGLEMPDVRRAAGKSSMGTLKISAKQESDRVVIEISDDGKGIDPAVIKRKAYEKGLIDEAALDRLTDQEAVNLVFAAGFSTAEKVTDLSGRGVGMDVVRTAVELVNGSIALESIKGRGTTLRLSLPLSMAVSNVMTVESDGQMFGVPMDVVVETVRVPRSSVRTIKKRQATVLRGKVVPLVSLNRLLEIPAEPMTNDDDELAALVVRVGDGTLALLVDEFHGTADIILKPLAGVLSSLRVYSGSALMGDGSVLMVLNVKELL